MVELNTLYDKVRESYVFDCVKHQLANDADQFATNKINDLSNNDLLMQISWALYEIEKAK